MVKTSEHPYEIDGKKFTGFLADGSNGRKVPGIVVAHEGGGMTNHPKERAKMLAEHGYVAFAMDTFGERITSREQAMAIIGALMGDLPTLRKRARTALDIVKAQPNVDAKRTGAIGFCFGGTTVLELARSGADVGCVVGFHSGLRTSAPADAKNIKAKILVLVGAADPVIPPEQRDAFVAEMEAGKVDWRMELFGGVGHSFTNREVDAMKIPGFAYDEKTDKRSWRAMRDLFDEVLGPIA
jgi:dienelactone hydrolase